MASLADIRARLAAQDTRSQRTQSSTGDSTLYPHWNIPENSTATIRFLPDGNPDNEFFWVERQLIKLPFNSVIGRPDIKRIEVQVPCVEAYGESCPVHAELRAWYKDESLKEMASRYWKKRSYLFQGFVRSNPLQDDKTPENPIRRFIISSQIYTIIKSSLLDPEMEELPIDYMRGLDFFVKKTTKSGGYADYSTSNWSRKESALTDTEQAAIDQYGLFNLTDFMPKKPGAAELEIIMEMFQASVDGKAYDLDRWGNYYKPWGLGQNADDASKKSSETVAMPTQPAKSASSAYVEPVEEPVEAEAVRIPPKSATPAVSSDKAQDILALIRARQNKTA
jgi:hypothetical protein